MHVAGLKVRWAPDREFYVENALNVVVDDGAAALAAFQSGLKHKIMASHKMNATSSRAHCVFTMASTGAGDRRQTGRRAG